MNNFQGLLDEIMTLKKYEKIDIRLTDDGNGIIWTKSSTYKEVVDMNDVRRYTYTSNKGKQPMQ